MRKFAQFLRGSVRVEVTGAAPERLLNALAGADYDAYAEIYYTLSDTVRADFKAQSAYWDQFRDSVPQKASNTVYDSFLKSNDQELGMQSYGACVNLLVHYYIDEAREALG